jgi:hypothetical protein
VCGLVLLELFKIAMGKGTLVLRTRQVGLAVNTYPSFDADNLTTYKSSTREVKPDPLGLPAEVRHADMARKGRVVLSSQQQ